MMRARVVVGVVLGLLLQPVLPARAAFIPDDPRFDRQWGLHTIGGPVAWERGLGNGITIAIIDSGIDVGHEDFAGRIAAHVSCIGARNDPDRCEGPGQDDHGHGTHVAGIAAARTGNGVGVASVAPGAGLLAVKVLEADAAGGATGSISDVRAGVRWAVDHGAEVINLSLGENVLVRNLIGSGLEGVIEEAWDEGVITTVAAGNTDSLFGSGYGSLPALVVAATTRDDSVARYSTDIGDAGWGIAAPGGDTEGDLAGKILSTHWNPNRPNEYAWLAGTSMAAPHVAGAAAVLLSQGLTPLQTVERLLGTAVDLGPPGRDRDYGYGRLDLAAATGGTPASGQFPAPVTTTTAPPPPPDPPVVAAAPPAEAPVRPTPSAPEPTTTTTAAPITVSEPVAAGPRPAPDPPTGETVAGWGIVAATTLALATLGLRGVWRRRWAGTPARH